MKHSFDFKIFDDNFFYFTGKQNGQYFKVSQFNSYHSFDVWGYKLFSAVGLSVKKWVQMWKKKFNKKRERFVKKTHVSISSWRPRWWPAEAARGQRPRRCPRECPDRSSSPWGCPSRCAPSRRLSVRSGTCALRREIIVGLKLDIRYYIRCLSVVIQRQTDKSEIPQ